MAASMTLLAAKPAAGASHAPAQLGGDTAAASCYGPSSARRLVADTLCNQNANITCYRYSPALEDWVLLADAAQAVTQDTPKETRWQTNGAEGYYALVTSAGAGTWQPIPAPEGP